MRAIQVVRRGLAIAVVASLMVVAVPVVATAQGADAVLYELAEWMQLVTQKSVTKRNAVAGLSGFAALGTPLCPSSQMLYNETSCWVSAIGQDSIDVATGKGPLSGQFVVVVQGDNPSDAPEYGVMHGQFAGTMDLSTAQTLGLGRMTGTMQANGQSFGFVGVVRLPFTCGPNGEACFVTSGPDGVPTGYQPLDALEYVMGAGAVRMDIWFQ